MKKVVKKVVVELHQGIFGLDVRKDFLTEKVVRHWKRLPREVAVSLEVFERCVDDLGGLFRFKRFYNKPMIL